MTRPLKSHLKLLKRLASRGATDITASEFTTANAIQMIDELARDDLICRPQVDKIALTPQGRAFLKRAKCEMSDPYASQHRIVVHRKDASGETLRVNEAESPLARLYNRKGRDGARLVNDAQFMAGQRLRRDFEMGQMSPRLGLSLVPRVDGSRSSGGPADLTDDALCARDRVNGALKYVGQELASVLLDVCCFLKGLETVEKERSWPVRSGKVVLGLALERLADHYGLSNVATGAFGDRKR
ncbi:MAG: DUF6456 domain-containing protein [Pseudomonadota bacterium]